VRVTDDEFNEDRKHASDAGKLVLDAARRDLERDGIARERLRRCETDHRDGTNLPLCMKAYLPPPDGAWGVVLQLAQDDEGWHLLAIAFGARHPTRRPRVYDVAHRRLHGNWPTGMHADQ
jgi:hypothetical protein